MNGIWVKDQYGESIELVTGFDFNNDDREICISARTIDSIDWDVAFYSSTEKFDRAWAMLENAIASGVRLFRFPTDAELEKGEDE